MTLSAIAKDSSLIEAKLAVGNRNYKLQRKLGTFLTNICIQSQLNCIKDNLKYKKTKPHRNKTPYVSNLT